MLTKNRSIQPSLTPFPPTSIRVLPTPYMDLVDVFRQRRRIFEHGLAVWVAARVNFLASYEERRDGAGATGGSDDFGWVVAVEVVRMRMRVDVGVRMGVMLMLRRMRVRMRMSMVSVSVGRVDVGVRRKGVGVVVNVGGGVGVGVGMMRVRVVGVGVRLRGRERGVIVSLIARRVRRRSDVRRGGSTEERGVRELAGVKSKGREVIIGVSSKDVVSRIAAL